MLTRDEDEELRRINFLAQFGDLPDAMISRFVELRSRDRRMEVRDPTIEVHWIPQQRSRDTAEDMADAAEYRSSAGR